MTGDRRPAIYCVDIRHPAGANELAEFVYERVGPFDMFDNHPHGCEIKSL